ncbi:MAG: amidohydrolase family protein [Candidatus Korobacteraceae bacterium]|jgi:2,3-dihydroxybenzoate decarboxylase
MQGKIAVEEHFAFGGTIDGAEALHGKSAIWPALRRRLLDLHDERIAQMDKLGVELSMLSLNAPVLQAMTNTREAVELARRANDYVAEQVAKRPDRFAAFAALPMQDPDASAQELTRCVKELGFKGTLINGFTHREGNAESVVHYDLPEYWPFWEVVESLDVPFYMHPRDPVSSQQKLYAGQPWLLTAAWAFGVETSTHALRLICSGLFDKYPRLNIVLGHLGEGISFGIWRVDHATVRDPRGITIKKKPSEYFRSNFYFSTSGNFHTLSLQNLIAEVGTDRIMFAADYPYEPMDEAAEWFDNASINETDRLKIARTNALKLFKLGKNKSCCAH